jgi:hypothetical protein
MRTPRGPHPVTPPLTDRQRGILEEMVRSRRRPHDEVQRASIMNLKLTRSRSSRMILMSLPSPSATLAHDFS